MIVSAFADDPEMAQLIEQFAGSLAGRIVLIESAHAAGDLAQLATLAHQLKGAGGGYGFAQITSAGESVESAISSGADATTLAATVSQLTAICREVLAPSVQGRRG
jgi:HPt (histidine-containing phosphotransfer) domain-containing protein